MCEKLSSVLREKQHVDSKPFKEFSHLGKFYSRCSLLDVNVVIGPNRAPTTGCLYVKAQKQL